MCGLPATIQAKMNITDRPMFRIESSAELNQRSGEMMGDGLYYLVMQRPDFQEELCSRSPLKWDDVVKLAHDLRNMTYSKARMVFLRKADEAAGTHESLRAKVLS